MNKKNCRKKTKNQNKPKFIQSNKKKYSCVANIPQSTKNFFKKFQPE